MKKQPLMRIKSPSEHLCVLLGPRKALMIGDEGTEMETQFGLGGSELEPVEVLSV